MIKFYFGRKLVYTSLHSSFSEALKEVDRTGLMWTRWKRVEKASVWEILGEH